MSEQIRQIEEEIKSLETKKQNIYDNLFKKASSNWFTLLHMKYESASYRTKEYLIFHRVFKRQFKKLLENTFDIKRTEFFKPNHFDAGGFFELQDGRIFYFSIGDLRWSKCFLIRTAGSFKDYTGGTNQYCSIDDYDKFMSDLKRIVQ